LWLAPDRADSDGFRSLHAARPTYSRYFALISTPTALHLSKRNALIFLTTPLAITLKFIPTPIAGQIADLARTGASITPELIPAFTAL
jgi:hypothetical protein